MLILKIAIVVAGWSLGFIARRKHRQVLLAIPALITLVVLFVDSSHLKRLSDTVSSLFNSYKPIEETALKRYPGLPKQEAIAKYLEDLHKIELDNKSLRDEQDKNVRKIESLEKEDSKNKRTLADLKKKTEPRTLSAEQRAGLAQFLPAPANFQIAAACRLMDSESCAYAEDLIEVFRGLKWQVGPTIKNFLDDIPNDVVVAITQDAQIPTANRVMAALNKVGLKASNHPIRKESISGVRSNTLYLIVGSRTPS